MFEFTLTDSVNDTLEVEVFESCVDLTAVEDGDRACVTFGREQVSEIRKLSDALREWLGNDKEDPLVRASEVSFNEGLMRLAAVHGKTVTFRYAKGGGQVIETRVLKPENVQQVGDHVTFTGFDPDRDEPRAYRVDRIKGEVSVN